MSRYVHGTDNIRTLLLPKGHASHCPSTQEQNHPSEQPASRRANTERERQRRRAPGPVTGAVSALNIDPHLPIADENAPLSAGRFM